MKEAYSVAPHYGGGWSVRRHGRKRATKVFKDRLKAVVFGRISAKGHKCPLYIHRWDGAVEKKEDYGDE